MDSGELYGALNALDVAFVKRDGNKVVTGLREGSEDLAVVMASKTLTGEVSFLVNGVTADNRLSAGALKLPTFERSPVGESTVMSFPNPYPEQANAPVHPAILFFPNGWGGYRYWVVVTPYPADNSVYENPCIFCSNDFNTWASPSTNPIVNKPAPVGAYNSDPHIFMSGDGLTMYLAFRERGVLGANNLKVMHSTNGISWSNPVTIMTGTAGGGGQDFASPSIWWNGTGWTLISHNLDGTIPWPIERRVSSSADIYGAWGVASSVVAAPLPGRAWWHSFFVRSESGQVIGILQDNAQIGGASGTLYLAESGDDGQSFGAVRQIYTPNNKYRSCFYAEKQNGALKLRVMSSDFSTKTITAFYLRSVGLDGVAAFNERLRTIISSAAFGLSGIKWADTFKRADNAAVVGTPDSGGAYIVSSGTWGISANSAYPVTNGKLLAEASVSAYRAGVQMYDMTTASQQWFIFRSVDGSNCWRVGAQNPPASGQTALTLQSVVGGAVVFNSTVGSISRGDFISVESSPSGFSIYVNGVLQYEKVDGLHGTATQFGIQSNLGANSKYRHLTCEEL